MPLATYKSKRLRLIFVVYWVLLIYIVAALVWWFIALNRQNSQMIGFEMGQLKTDAPDYASSVAKLQWQQRRKEAQYIGEGSIFMVLILAGAFFIYRAVRRQLQSGVQQQHFMMAITHELKTPIAITKLNLETLLKRRLEDHQQEKLLRNTIQEANRLNALCSNLLLASQMDAGGYGITTEAVDLSQLASECVEDFRIRFPLRKIELNIVPDCLVKGDQLLLQMAINNLLDNALKYTSKELPIALHLKKKSDSVVLEVKDQGKGIPDAEKQQVFNKYHRLGNSATKAAKGTGLGLYLTRKIVQQHGASIVVADNQPSGAIFRMQFKL